MPPDVLQQPRLLCQVGAPHVAWRTDRPGRMESPSRSKRRWHTQRHPQIVRTRHGKKGEAAISERPTSVSEGNRLCLFSRRKQRRKTWIRPHTGDIPISGHQMMGNMIFSTMRRTRGFPNFSNKPKCCFLKNMCHEFCWFNPSEKSL